MPMPLPFSRKGDGLKRALFLCRDNRLLSRFCEELFNSLVRAEGLNWQAVSRALSVDALKGSIEPMAPQAVARLRSLGAAPVNHRRLPLAATAFDFEMSFVTIAIEPVDGQAAVRAAWPGFADRIEFWDIDPAAAGEAQLADIARSVRRMLDQLLGRDARPDASAVQARPGAAGSAKLLRRPPRASELSHVRDNETVSATSRASSRPA
jgi:protein-tyrosine-phosphatase